MAQFEIKARLEFNSTVTVEAMNADDAVMKFNHGEFVDDGLDGAEMANWTARSQPKACD